MTLTIPSKAWFATVLWMTGLWVTGLCAPVSSPAWADVLSLVNPSLAELREQRAAMDAELADLGPMPMGQTCDEIGSQFHMVETPPSVAPWVQLDLGSSTRFDSVMIVPAIAASSTSREAAYGFPRGFRVDASEVADFSQSELLYQTSPKEMELRLGIPVVIKAPNRRARYLRVTITHLANVSGRWTYALGEIIVLAGNRNIAIDSKVTMALSPALPPKWDDHNLVDGRTPLGPPIRRDLPEMDGVYTAPDAPDSDKWMLVDLGKVLNVEDIRVHPIYARQGANLPGYAFPKRFRVETSISESFQDAFTVFDSGSIAFSNPGDNPITLDAHGTAARYIRITSIESWQYTQDVRFGLSELQAYSGGKNVALGARATIPGDLGDRPASLLTDGYDSMGRLIELPQWMDRWSRYRQLQIDLADNEERLRHQTAIGQRRLLWFATTFGALILTVGVASIWWRRHRQNRELRNFRESLARDLHDEIGSNLAAIARLGEVAQLESETGQSNADWQAVSQMANECTDSMRETLWLLGGRQEQGGQLPDRLHRIAKRMLPYTRIHWEENLQELDFSRNAELNRELLLVFKEIIANVAKHSQATELDVQLRTTKKAFDLSVADNGIGFRQSSTRRGMGLDSIDRRMKKMGGTVDIESTFGKGTTIRLKMPALAI